MADEPEVKPGETVVEQPTGSEAPGETATGTEAADAATKAAQEREAFLNSVVPEIVSRVVAQVRSVAQPTTTTPPTPAAGPLADLEREAQAIEAEDRALKEQFQRDGGWTADTIIRRQDLVDRKSNWRAEATLRAAQLERTQVMVEKAGEEPGWLEYFANNKHRGDVDLLRAAWERDQMKNAPPKPAAPQPKLTERAPAPNVSGAAEVTASERKARTMTLEQVKAQKAKWEEEGEHAKIRELDTSLRNGDVLLQKT